MKIISHRRNTLQQLVATPFEHGVEVDIRSVGQQLVIHHDPYVGGESFDAWISAYRHGTLILNVKEEGLEERLIALMQEHRIDDYFFLDQSLPFLVKWARAGQRRAAVRVSEFEPVVAALRLAGQVDWAWIDCFTRFPLTGRDAGRLKDAGFRLCLVSPELQGRDAVTGIEQLAALLYRHGITADAVCTKRPDLWARAATLPA
ncbi:MAG: hypothetical protein ACI83P_001572 [Janthinobacterium sp.]|jgi:hypothetical protein